jgi:L-threonylcarbamoyladenylate synthase
VARIFEAKSRPQFDPLIVHVADLRQAEILVTKLPEAALRLAEKFWPGPLTLVLPKSDLVPDLVTSSMPTVAIRVPRHPLALELIRESGRPIAAPSANPFGQVSPTTAEHVRRCLGNKVDLILDGGACAVGVESTIVSLVGKTPVLLRPGGVPLEEIEALVGPVTVQTQAGPKPMAPGQLEHHYAPRTPLFLGHSGHGGRVGYLGLQTPGNADRYQVIEALSEKGDLREAAACLFAAMRRLDDLGLDRIEAFPVPHEGLGLAINDRLQRAALKPNIS